MAVEWLNRAWVSQVYADVPYLFAMGDQPMRDLLKDFDFGSNVHVALLGSGDIRHVIKTISELKNKKRQPSGVHILINDIDNCIIARNVLLLEAILTLNPKNEDDFTFVWNIWYNMEISKAHYKKLTKMLNSLITDCEQKRTKKM